MTGRAEGGSTLLEVGRIVRPHGIRGEVVVEAVSNRPERFVPGSELTGGGREFVIRRAGPHGGPDPAGRVSRRRWIVAFEGVEDRTQAERLRGTVLLGEPLAGAEADGDELWVHELVGAEVTDPTGAVLGRIVAVEANPASDLLVLEAGTLVPMVFVIEAGPGRVVIDPPAGLFDL